MSRSRYLICSVAANSVAPSGSPLDKKVSDRRSLPSFPVFRTLNRYTLRWRSMKASQNPAELELMDEAGRALPEVAYSSLDSCGSGSSNASLSSSAQSGEISSYMDFWAHLGIRSSAPSSPARTSRRVTLTGLLRSVSGIAWFGEHSLVVVGMRKSRYFIDVLTREPLPDSSAQPGGGGIPTPKVDHFSNIFT